MNSQMPIRFRQNNARVEIEAIYKTVFNQVPPSDIEMEKAILGAIMLERDAIYEVLDILIPEVFHDYKHEIIYKAILSLYEKGLPLDSMTVANAVISMQDVGSMKAIDYVGGLYYITTCSNHVVSSGNLRVHAAIIRQHWTSRMLIRECMNTIQLVNSRQADIFDLVADHSDRVSQLTGDLQGRKDPSIPRVAVALLKQIEKGMTSDGLTGVPTLIPRFDEVTGGLQPSTLTIIAARPGDGKSAIFITIAQNSSSIKNPEYDGKTNKQYSMFPWLILSLEMRDTEVFARIVSAELFQMGYHIPYSRIKRGMITEEELKLINMAIERLAARGLYIDDTSSLDVHVLKAIIQRYIKQYNIKGVGIDYAQLATSSKVNKNGSKTDILEQVARVSKLVAKHFDIPVLLLSQMLRGGDSMDALKGSGALEECADCIILPKRDPEGTGDVAGVSTVDEMLLRIVKHKMGPTEDILIPYYIAYNAAGPFDGEIVQKINEFMGNQNRF